MPIGIQAYQQDGMGDVLFARNDAMRFSEALTAHLGIPRDNIQTWTDGEATRTRLEHDVAYTISQLRKDDRFVFFYAGHGFWAGGANRLTAWDTHPHHVRSTTVDVEEVLLKPLRASPCQQSMVFIDSCAVEVEDYETRGRDVIADMKRSEFEEFVKTNAYSAAFFSCSQKERSFPAKLLEHGIWTFHLLKALRGEAPPAAVRGVVTGQSLQDYLAVEVPRFIREETRIKGRQRPYALIGSGGAFEIRSMPRTRTRRGKGVLQPDFASAFFQGRERRRFDRLPGFDKAKRHTVPTEHNGSAASWAGRLLAKEMNEEIDAVYHNAKTLFGMRRSEISLNPATSGSSVDTDFFRFGIAAGQDEDDPAYAVLSRDIVLCVPYAELPEDFDSIFPAVVDEFVIPLQGSTKYEVLADALEDFAMANGLRHVDDPRKRTVELTSKDGTSLVFDAKRRNLTIRSPGGSDCVAMIGSLEQPTLTRLLGTVPDLIGPSA